MQERILYHGSAEIVRRPLYGKGKVYNDYGQGFYCTEEIELAKEWACTENEDGYVNEYKVDMNNLNILDLSSEEYTILHWLAMLMRYRVVRLSSPIMKRGHHWLIEHFLPELAGKDIIIGYRADDSYFSYARAFVNNEISVAQLSYAMKLGKLGEQVVIKSEEAFDRIRFHGSVYVDRMEYYPKRQARDLQARELYIQELEKEDVNGLYIRDLIREEVRGDDPRLR